MGVAFSNEDIVNNSKPEVIKDLKTSFTEEPSEIKIIATITTSNDGENILRSHSSNIAFHSLNNACTKESKQDLNLSYHAPPLSEKKLMSRIEENLNDTLYSKHNVNTHCLVCI